MDGFLYPNYWIIQFSEPSNVYAAAPLTVEHFLRQTQKGQGAAKNRRERFLLPQEAVDWGAV